ncbi:MAG TPA: hypothetical protein VGR52_07955 [Stellaceae bacterium]|nr:hypothetical protein [Stellaceae bacterium]
MDKAADQYRETNLRQTDFTEEKKRPSSGWDRPLPEKLLIANFVAQVLFGFGYGLSLFLVNIWYPEVTQWLAQHLSAVTDPVARYLPIAIYADTLANPQLNLSAILIRHVFSFLMLVSLVPGVIFFGFCKEFAASYGRSLKASRTAVKKSMYVLLFLSICSSLALFVFPVIPSKTGMDDFWYLYGCVSPGLFFFSVPQVIAIAWAYCVPDRKAETAK